MLSFFNKPDMFSLIANIGVAVFAALVMNGIIFLLGWDKSTNYAPEPSFTPPGYVIGIVWIVLFAFMATARWNLNLVNYTAASQARWLVTLLIIFCLLWPLYSIAIGSIIGGLIGNIATIVLAIIVVVFIWPVSFVSACLVMPVIAWVAFATLIVLGQLGWLGIS